MMFIATEIFEAFDCLLPRFYWLNNILEQFDIIVAHTWFSFEIYVTCW